MMMMIEEGQEGINTSIREQDQVQDQGKVKKKRFRNGYHMFLQSNSVSKHFCMSQAGYVNKIPRHYHTQICNSLYQEYLLCRATKHARK